MDCTVGKVVDQQVDAHARRHAEYRGQTEADGGGMLHQVLLDLDFFDGVLGDRIER